MTERTARLPAAGSRPKGAPSPASRNVPGGGQKVTDTFIEIVRAAPSQA